MSETQLYEIIRVEMSTFNHKMGVYMKYLSAVDNSGVSPDMNNRAFQAFERMDSDYYNMTDAIYDALSSNFCERNDAGLYQRVVEGMLGAKMALEKMKSNVWNMPHYVHARKINELVAFADNEINKFKNNMLSFSKIIDELVALNVCKRKLRKHACRKGVVARLENGACTSVELRVCLAADIREFENEYMCMAERIYEEFTLNFNEDDSGLFQAITSLLENLRDIFVKWESHYLGMIDSQATCTEDNLGN